MPEICIQIQPRYDEREKWIELAENEALFFEPIELYTVPAMLSREYYDELYSWYKRIGRIQSIHGAFIDVNPASSAMAVREYSRKCCEDSCRTAKELGAERVVFHSSCAPFLRGAYLDNWANITADYFTELAQKHKLTVYLENSMDIDPVPLSEVMKRVGGSGVQVCLDIGHVNYSGEPMEEWFERLGDSIGYMHLSDNMGRYDDHLALGDGTVNWETADRLWRMLGRNIPVTLEVGGTDGVKRSLEYLGRNGFFSGGRGMK